MYTIAETNSQPTLIQSAEPANATTFYSAGEEVLRISKDGFWVRGVRVPADDKEYQEVYNAFRQWLVWQNLTHE